MRSILALACVLVASASHAQQLISPGPPSNPAEYIKLTFDVLYEQSFEGAQYADPDGQHREIPIINNMAWSPWRMSGQGQVDIWLDRVIDNRRGISGIDFRPENDLGMRDLGIRVRKTLEGGHDITISGPNGYSRSYYAPVPEPASVSLLALGALSLAPLLRQRSGGPLPLGSL